MIKFMYARIGINRRIHIIYNFIPIFMKKIFEKNTKFNIRGS